MFYKRLPMYTPVLAKSTERRLGDLEEQIKVLENKMEALIEYLDVEEHSVPQHYKVVKKEVKND